MAIEPNVCERPAGIPVLSRDVLYISTRVDGLGGNSSYNHALTGRRLPHALVTAVKVEITFPRNFSPYPANKPIEVRGNATWEPAGPSPVQSMQLSTFESRWDGIAFGRWIHVNDFPLSLVTRE